MASLFGFDSLMVWGIFTKLIGLLLAWAIIQLYPQLLNLVGSKGINPFKNRLALIERDFSLGKRIFFFPSLFWLNRSDRMLRFVIISGAMSGLWVALGLPYASVAFAYCFIVLLSLDQIYALSFPWDSVLFEACFLAIFLPQSGLLNDWAISALPHPVISFLYRFLLFRLLFGFGKFKFSKLNFKDQGYFRNFLVNIPIASPVANAIYRFPGFVFQGMLVFAFIVEIVFPFLLFIPGMSREVAAIGIICLMIGIQLLSNFGFFNVLTIAVAVCLFDSGSFIWTDWHPDFSHSSEWGYLILLGFIGLGGLLNLPFNSWCTFTWLHWPSALNVRITWIRKTLDFYRDMQRFRLVHAYGVFPADSPPPMKLIPLIEGSMDGKTWEPYPYKYALSLKEDWGHFIAPYHPRLDHAVFYDTFAVNDTNFNWSTASGSFPYDYARKGGLDYIIQELLAGNPAAFACFRSCPFGAQTPKWVRAGLHYAVRGKKDKEWDIHFADIHRVPQQWNPNFALLSESEPELFHWDAHYWRMRTKKGKLWKSLAQETNPELVLNRLLEGLTINETFFWNDFFKNYVSIEPNWNLWRENSESWEKVQSLDIQKDVWRYWNRLRIVLGTRLMPQFLDKDKPLTSSNYFLFGLFLNELLSYGKELFMDIWKNPDLIYSYHENFSESNGFYMEAFFRPECTIDIHRKMKWSLQISSEESNTVLPGFNRLVQFLHDQELNVSINAWPSMEFHPKTGEWTIGQPKQAELLMPELVQAYQDPASKSIPY